MSGQLLPHKILRWASCLGAAALLLPCPAPGQSHSNLPVREGSIEIGISAGNAVAGLAEAIIPLPVFKNQQVGSPGSGAVSLEANLGIRPTLELFGAISLIKGSHEHQILGGGFTSDTNLLNIIYQGGVRRSFPIASGRVAPLASLSGSTITKRVDNIVNFQPGDSNLNPGSVAGGASRIRYTRAVFAIAPSVGLRYSVSRNIGFRLEARAYFPTADVTTPICIVEGGIVLRIR